MTKRILIADEESLITSFLQSRLTREEFFVDMIGDGQLALALIMKHRYDVIVVDLMLPNIAGRELVSAIQQSNLNSETPIIVLSSLSSDELIVDVLNSGVKEYVLKPYSMNVIVTKIRQLSLMNMAPN